MIFGLTAFGAVHFLLGLTSIGLGARILMRRKGTRGHKSEGRWFFFAMVWLNIAGLMVHQDARGYGLFHLLAGLSLAMLGTGMFMGWTARGRRARVLSHAYFMTWAYAGLLTAGVGQGVAAFGGPVGWVIVVCLIVASVFIHYGGIERAEARR